MSRKKDVVINIHDPLNIERHRFEGGFTLSVIDLMDDSGRQKRVNLKFERWWLPIIAEQLRAILDEEQSELEFLRKQCGFSDD